MLRISRVRRSLLAVVIVGGFASIPLGLALRQATAATTFSDGTPSQGVEDLAASAAAGANGGSGWGDWSSGVSARPYVTSLSVINGGTTTQVVQNGTIASSEAATASGALTTVVTPTNLCRAGQTAAPGVCYSSPNRVQVTLAYGNPGTPSPGAIGTPPVGFNFLAPNVPTTTPITPTVNASSTIDMTINLNGLGSALRWSWVDGDLLYWQVSGSGTGTTVHLQFHPALAPVVAGQANSSGCTATPITGCSVNQATANVLTASVMFSVDNTLPASLAGAVFATQQAVFGFLQPGGTATAPTLGYQVSSSHNQSDGATPESGTLEALIPSAALLNLYNLLPADAASVLTVTRDGDTGTNNPTTLSTWTAATNGTDGLFVKVTGITFSVPDYVVAGSLPQIVMHSSVRSGKTTIKAKIATCKASSKCVATLYDLGASTSGSSVTTATPVLKNRRLSGRSFALVVRSSKLPKGHRYLMEIHSLRLKKVLASSTGTVG